MTNNNYEWTAEKIIDVGVKLNVTSIIIELIEQSTPTGDNIVEAIDEYIVKNNIKDIAICEWWAIEKNLGRDLQENNEFIYNNNIMYDLWGRQIYNQGLKSDSIFALIANIRNKRLHSIKII